jgi:predicted enzyme related to lactoylglutathione lyase
MNKINSINFIEFPAQDVEALNAAKKFYEQVFEWSFKDWGDDYADTTSSGLDCGFNADPSHRPHQPLAVIYVTDLEAACKKVKKSGGKITKAIFSFPGGRRFHFQDPAGNELAIWSDK